MQFDNAVNAPALDYVPRGHDVQQSQHPRDECTQGPPFVRVKESPPKFTLLILLRLHMAETKKLEKRVFS